MEGVEPAVELEEPIQSTDQDETAVHHQSITMNRKHLMMMAIFCTSTFSVPYKELQKYLASFFQKMAGGGEVLFNVKIDKKTGNVILQFWRMGQQQDDVYGSCP